MITVGIDLASQPKKTGACVIAWSASGARIEIAERNVGDRRLLELVRMGDKVGVDIPFGWPEKFSKWPLSVSSDLIAVPTYRAAALLSHLAGEGQEVDRAGRGRLIEVYPAAALIRWEIAGVKGEPAKLVAALAGRLGPRVELPPAATKECDRSQDVADALVAALIARAAALDLCDAIPAEHLAAAAVEGWVALPKRGSLELLVLEWDEAQERMRRMETAPPAPLGQASSPKISRPALFVDELPLCACGCGEATRGGRFKPGHDAKLHSRLLKERRASKPD